jgi:hypothetical protein
VPANWPLFEISLAGSGFDATSTRLVRRSDGVDVPVVAESVPLLQVRVAPLEDLVVGETYDLLHPSCPSEPTESTEYRATAPLPPPTALGVLQLSPLYATYRARGRENLVYHVEIELVLDPSMERWVDAYGWGPEVDGALLRFQRLSALQSGFLVDCNTGSWRGVGVPPGDRVIRGAAGTLPSRLALFTPSVETTFRCEDALIVHPDTYVPLTPDEIAYWDRVDMDGGAGSGLDGGVSSTVDGGRMGMHTEPDTNGSCAVGSRRGRAPGTDLLALAAVALIGGAMSRRRRQRAARS